MVTEVQLNDYCDVSVCIQTVCEKKIGTSLVEEI